MITVNIKPFSVNKAWVGKQRPTSAFKAYKESLHWQLPYLDTPKGRKAIFIEFGFSSPLSDWDNCIKITQDVIAKKYGFNDREIDQAVISKKKVIKGQEYIKFNLTEKLCGKCWLELNQFSNCEC
jgi:Holliday junction resolvase RusA-like endonuclease